VDSKAEILLSDTQTTKPTSTTSNSSLGVLPETPQRGLHCSPTSAPCPDSIKQDQAGKTPQESTCEALDVAATPESRAASRKQQVLAKVAEEQANVRKQRFVFGKSGTTPIRTPNRKKAESQNRSDASGGEAGTQA